jgi:hypothetical protein
MNLYHYANWSLGKMAIRQNGFRRNGLYAKWPLDEMVIRQNGH